ncbi:purine-binding chemotaxis protein CheW [Candidatus Magnetomoraceae bacterium gMMP-15]
MTGQFITFKIKNYFFGINVLRVKEINQVLDITSVQHAPNYVLGLVNLRGRVITVFDTGVLLGLNPGKITEQSHNIVLKNEFVGLLVDSIGDVNDIDMDKIESVPANLKGIADDFIKGVIRFKNEVIMILSIKRILNN